MNGRLDGRKGGSRAGTWARGRRQALEEEPSSPLDVQTGRSRRPDQNGPPPPELASLTHQYIRDLHPSTRKRANAVHTLRNCLIERSESQSRHTTHPCVGSSSFMVYYDSSYRNNPTRTRSIRCVRAEGRRVTFTCLHDLQSRRVRQTHTSRICPGVSRNRAPSQYPSLLLRPRSRAH